MNRGAILILFDDIGFSKIPTTLKLWNDRIMEDNSPFSNIPTFHHSIIPPNKKYFRQKISLNLLSIVAL